MMLKIIINGRNIELTDAIKNYITDKFNRLDHHFDFIKEVHVFLHVEKNPRISANHTAEATVYVKGAVVRVEVSTEDLYASLDQLVDKVDRNLKKHKAKLLGRTKQAHSTETIRKAGFEEAVAEEGGAEPEEEEIFYTYEDEEEFASAPPTGK